MLNPLPVLRPLGELSISLMSALLRLRAGPVDRGWSLRKGVCVYVCDQVLFSAWGKQAWLSLVKFLGKRKFFLQLYFVFTQFLSSFSAILGATRFKAQVPGGGAE